MKNISGIDVIAGAVGIRFESASCKLYQLESSEAGPWQSVRNDIAGTGGTIEVAHPGGGGHTNRFYRIRLLP